MVISELDGSNLHYNEQPFSVCYVFQSILLLEEKKEVHKHCFHDDGFFRVPLKASQVTPCKLRLSKHKLATQLSQVYETVCYLKFWSVYSYSSSVVVHRYQHHR